ncbi:hypothetical protein [Curtobacterium sp. ME12]|uniref:hypothetical protein n=1 Tax=Curtobacterium sp. ME12 TaxID=2744253 RepID=UPI001C713C21|nr:hypothetical protein [Curtobacterium sp. ME12]
MLFDLLVVAGGVAAVILGRALTAAISGLSDIGTRVHAEGSAFQQQLAKTAAALGKIPFAGDTVSTPLRQASRNAGAIADAGTQQHDATVHVAHLAGGSVIVILLLMLLLTWIRYRGRFIRTATATNRVGRTPAGTELLAVRGLHRNTAATLGTDVVDRWRQRDPAVIAALADIEHRASGLRARGTEF